MNKSIIAGAVALALGSVATSASALVINVTAMSFGTTSVATGFVDTDVIGTTFSGTFFNAPWTATTQSAYTAVGVLQTWAGTSPQGNYSYNFTLTSTQVAFGTFFDWSTTVGIPVLAIFDETAPGVYTGVSGYPMQVGPFPGQNPTFNGVAPVPVPAAVWLFGSGLLGLVGIARRRKTA